MTYSSLSSNKRQGLYLATFGLNLVASQIIYWFLLMPKLCDRKRGEQEVKLAVGIRYFFYVITFQPYILTLMIQMRPYVSYEKVDVFDQPIWVITPRVSSDRVEYFNLSCGFWIFIVTVCIDKDIRMAYYKILTTCRRLR